MNGIQPSFFNLNRSQLMKNVTSNSPEITVRILKIGQCESITGKSTLTYHIGCTADCDIQLRVYANTAAGFFSQEWLALDAIEEALIKGGSPFSSMALKPLFQGKSQNNTGFLMAIALKEGLVSKARDKQRCYQLLDFPGFRTNVKALIDANVSLSAEDKPDKKPAASKAKSAKPSNPKPKAH